MGLAILDHDTGFEPEILREAIEIGEGKSAALAGRAHVIALVKALKNDQEYIRQLESLGCPKCGCRDQEYFEYTCSETGYTGRGYQCMHCGAKEEE